MSDPQQRRPGSEGPDGERPRDDRPESGWKGPLEGKGLFKLDDVQWDRFLKRYVWDDETTPYFVPVSRLTRRQANHELMAFAVFLGFMFAVLAVVTLSSNAPGGRSGGMSLYSFTVVCAAVLLGMTRHYYAALYCSSAAPGVLIWIYVFADHPGLDAIDHMVIIGFGLLWMRYGQRVIAITRGYDDMDEGVEPPNTFKRFGRRHRRR